MVKIAVAGTRGFPAVQGGVERHCEQLYTRLAKNGWNVTVFTRSPYVRSDLTSYKGITLFPIVCPRNKYLETLVHVFLCVLKARNLRHDILHIHAIGPSIYAPLARLIGMKVVVTHHGPDYRRDKWSMPAKYFLRFCERIGMTYAHEVIAITKNISDEIDWRFNRKAVVIPNGVEIPRLAESNEALKKFALEEQKYILSVGRFVPEKGLHDLVEAFLAGNFKGWKLVLVGSADHEDRYSRNLRRKVDRTDRIVLTGFLSGQPLHELYSYAGLFVLPSYYEGLPIVLLEALSYGLSCLASDIPANRCIEMADNRYFSPGHISALIAKIGTYIENPLSEQERNCQVRMIADRYNWDMIARQTETVYRRLVP